MASPMNVRASTGGDPGRRRTCLSKPGSIRRHRPPPTLPEPLTDRELEILRQIAEGLSNKEIATRLHLAGGTVKNYVTSILGKLRVSDRTQAALKARDLGLV